MPYRVLKISYMADGPETCWCTGDIADEQRAKDRAQTLLLRTKVNDDSDFIVMELPIARLSDLTKKIEVYPLEAQLNRDGSTASTTAIGGGKGKEEQDEQDDT